MEAKADNVIELPHKLSTVQQKCSINANLTDLYHVTSKENSMLCEAGFSLSNPKEDCRFEGLYKFRTEMNSRGLVFYGFVC